MAAVELPPETGNTHLTATPTKNETPTQSIRQEGGAPPPVDFQDSTSHANSGTTPDKEGRTRQMDPCAEPEAGLEAEISATNGVESAGPASSQHDQGQSPNNSIAAKETDGSKTNTQTKCTEKSKKKKKRHVAREQWKAKEVEMDISEEVSGAEEGEASSSRNSDDKEETEAKGAEEKQPQQSAVPDAAPPDGVDAPRKKPNTKKTKHKKTLNDVCMPMRQQAERESGQREHADQTGEAATAPPGNDAKLKGSRKKAKKLHKAMEAGKAKEAVRDSSSISGETVATVTMGGREEEEEESATIGLLDLPEEVLLGVLSFLAPLDLVLVSQACRLLQLLSREPTILRALREHHRIHKGKKRARLQPLFVHPAYYALEQPRYTLKQLESLETPSVVLDRLVEDGFFFLSLDEADLQIVRDMKAAASRFLASSEGLDAMSRRSMLYLKTSAAGYAEAPEINSFQTTVTHHRWFPWPDATDEDKAVATRYWRLMGRITVVLLTNLAKHLGIPMSVMELLLFSRKKVMHRYGDDSFLASDSVHVQWSCELCTLLNPGTRRTCAACQGPRPLARPEAVSANQVESEQTHGDGQQPRPLNEAATKETAETTAETIGSPFTRENLVAVTDEELDRLLAPTLKFYRFREIEKRRKDGWRGRDGSLRVFSAMTPRGANPAAAAAAADVVDVDHGLGAGDGMIHLLEEPTPLPLPPPLPQPTREDAQHQQHQQQSTGEQQRRKRKADFSTQLNMMPCNAMFKLICAHSTDPDLCQVELRTERPDSDNRPHRLPVSKMANEGDIAVFPSWSLRTFCAPFGVRFAYRQPSYRVRSRLVKVLPGSSSSTSAGGDLHDAPDALEKRPEARERSMSDPTTPGSTAQLQDRPLRASSSSKGKEKRDGRAGAGGGKSSSVIVLNKEAKRALVRKHKKAVLLLEYDSYVPPPELVRCMKKVITMMEKEGNKSVGRWYKKKRGRIIEACPWNRYYPSSSESESDLDTSEWGSSSDSFSTSSSDDDEDDEEAIASDDGDESESESDSDSDAEAYYGGFSGGRYSDSDMSSRSDDLARMRHRFEGSEDEAILADVSYWNGPMPLTKHERRERDRRDKRKRRIKKAKKVALTTAFVAAVPVTIVTAPIWLPIGGALALGLRFHFRRK